MDIRPIGTQAVCPISDVRGDNKIQVGLIHEGFRADNGNMAFGNSQAVGAVTVLPITCTGPSGLKV